MENFDKAKILRIYVSNTDKIKHETLYESLAYAAKRYGLLGVTVYKGIMGYGSSSHLSSDKFWTFSDKIPVTIEVIDQESKIRAFLDKVLPLINSLPKGCLITLQDTEIILAKKGNKKA
jgi:PII-like signaling protein